MSILLIGSVSAIYSGECLEVDLSSLESLDNVAYFVTGNSSNLNGMNITLNSTTKNVSVCFAIDYAPDSFTIIFMDDSTKEVIKEVHHSSGGTRKVYVDKIITEYLDRNESIDTISPIDLSGDLDLDEPKTKYNFIPWMIILVMFLYLVVSFIRSRKKIKGLEKQLK